MVLRVFFHLKALKTMIGYAAIAEKVLYKILILQKMIAGL